MSYSFDHQSTQLSYTIVDGNATIVGVLPGSTITDLVIPATVTDPVYSNVYPIVAIADSALSYISITSVTFAENSSLQSIGNQAFQGSYLSGSLIFPSSLQSIGDGAFGNGNYGLSISFAGTSAEVGGNLQSIGQSAFAPGPIVAGYDSLAWVHTQDPYPQWLIDLGITREATSSGSGDPYISAFFS